MKPAPFQYFAPATVETAHELLKEHGETCRIIAGGQSLVPMLNMRIIQPEVLISINHCPELNYIHVTSDSVSFGAAARQAVAEESQAVTKHCPLLAATLPFVGGAANRNRGTICGSLAHADPLAELTATAVALDAEFVISSAGSHRIVPAAEFFVSALTTCVEPGEMLQEVRFPVLGANLRCAFTEIGNRKHGFALVGIAAQFSIDEGGRCTDVRLAGIGLDATPMRLPECERLVTGNAPSEALFAAAGAAACAASEAEDDIHADASYRRSLAGVLVTRALHQAANSPAVKG
jgi:CO/xanthine dehydrogenase FAD-binding subunit